MKEKEQEKDATSIIKCQEHLNKFVLKEKQKYACIEELIKTAHKEAKAEIEVIEQYLRLTDLPSDLRQKEIKRLVELKNKNNLFEEYLND